MEKEKIINRVDVSECKYYVTYTKDCIDDNKSYNKCESCNDCYYKQLKRLEQENETLNYQWHKQSEIGDEWYKVAEKYKTALEEIRGINKYFFDMNYGFDEQGISEDVKEVAREIEEIITETIGVNNNDNRRRIF